MYNKDINFISLLSGDINCIHNTLNETGYLDIITGYILNTDKHNLNEYMREIREVTDKLIIYDNRHGNIPTNKLDSLAGFGIEKVIVRQDSGIEYFDFREIEPIIDVSNKSEKNMIIGYFYPHIREFVTNEFNYDFITLFNDAGFYIGEDEFSRNVSTDKINGANFDINVMLNPYNPEQNQEIKMAA